MLWNMIFRELFVEDFKERSCNVGSHVLAKGWITPNDVSVAVFLVEFEDCVMCGVNLSR